MRKGFTGTAGRHSMDMRGALPSDDLKHHAPGTFAIVPAAAARDRRLGKITPRDVLAELCRYRNAVDYACYPSLERVALDLGISRRSVQKHIKKLIDCGHLAAQSRVRQGRGGWTSNQYWILFPSVENEKPALPARCEDGIAPDTGLKQKAPSEPALPSGGDASPSDATVAPSEGAAVDNLERDASPSDATVASLGDAPLRHSVTHKHLNQHPTEQTSDAYAREPVENAKPEAAEPVQADRPHEARQRVIGPNGRRMYAPPRDPLGELVKRLSSVTRIPEGTLWCDVLQWHGDLEGAGYCDADARQVIAEVGRPLGHGALQGDPIAMIRTGVLARIDARQGATAND